MSPTSYLTAPPRVAVKNIATVRITSTGGLRLSDVLAQSLEDLLDARVVGRVLLHVRPDDLAVLLDQRGPAQLGDVADRPPHSYARRSAHKALRHRLRPD